MHDLDLSSLLPIVKQHPYPLLFATVSGAHLYGFPSPDSDIDLRGVHLLTADDLFGLDPAEATVERSLDDGRELDLVTHDAGKFFSLLLKRNGYVLEQLYSPLVVQALPEHAELKELAAGCITRHHVHHYLGFARGQWTLALKSSPPRVKPMLYVFRVLLTGIHLMRTGQVEANLVTLNETFGLPYIVALVERKLTGPENGVLEGAEMEQLEAEYHRLTSELEQAGAASSLPDAPTARAALNDLLIRLRRAYSL